MKACLRLTLAVCAACLAVPAAAAPAKPQPATGGGAQVQAVARVQIIEAATTTPLDRKAARKGHDRETRKRAGMTLIEYY